MDVRFHLIYKLNKNTLFKAARDNVYIKVEFTDINCIGGINMKRLVEKLDHYVVYTSDVSKIIDFYTKLGFEESLEQNKPVLIGPSFKIKIHGPGSTAKPVPRNISRGSIDLCFESNLTPNEIKQYLAEKEIPIYEGPVPRVGFKGNMTSIYVLDPEGNLIELSYYSNVNN